MPGMRRSALLALGAATAVAAFGLGRLTTPAPRPPVSDDLAGAIRSALGEGDTLARLATTTSLLDRLDSESLPGVLAVYERMLPSLEIWELDPFFSAWARFDPAGAVEHVLAWPRRDLQEQRKRGVRVALEGWAQADPSGAREEAAKLAVDNPRLRDFVWSSVARGWVRSAKGVEGLGSMLAEVRPTQHRDAAVGAALRELAREGGAEPALVWADAVLRSQTDDPGFQRAVFDGAVREAAVFDPKRTSGWVVDHADAAFARQGPEILVDRWARTDGAAAMGWLGELHDGGRRDEAVRAAFLQWSRADRADAQAWLEAAPATTFRDPAIEVLADQLLARAPEEALSWCERIQDPARRRACLEPAAKRWYGWDAVAAETWLQRSPLDEEARSAVRRSAELQVPAGRRRRAPPSR